MTEPKKGAAKKTTRRASTTKYIRNKAFSPFSVRLVNNSKKRIELKARGQRGDCYPLEASDVKDPAIVRNALAIEVISEAEALQIMEKQTTNQQAVHPAIARLNNPNPHGPKMEFKGTDYSEAEKSVTVATFDQHDPNRQARSQAFVHRSDGSAPPREEVPGSVDMDAKNAEDAALQKSDEIARSKNVEGPKAGLGGFTFVEEE